MRPWSSVYDLVRLDRHSSLCRYGPRPKPPPYSPQGTLNLEVKFAPFASHPRRAPLRVSASHWNPLTSSFSSNIALRIHAVPSLTDPLQDTEPAALSTLLTQLLLPSLHLHLLPKSSVDVYLLVLESDTLPSVLSGGLTVASAAIADAGIAMGALGVGAVVAGEKGGLLVDPTKQEEQERGAVLTAGIMPALNRVTNLWLTGETEVDDAVKVSPQAGGEG